MFSWRISDNSSIVFCLMNLQSKLFWNELRITYATMVWNHVFLKNFWWIKSCFLFEPSRLAVKMKFSMHGILLSWRIFHIIVGCVIRCLFWQLITKIDKIEDKTSFEHLALKVQTENKTWFTEILKENMIPYQCNICDTKFISTASFEIHI